MIRYSIVIPVREVHEQLARLVEILSEQPGEDFEFLLCVAVSDPALAERCALLSSVDSRFRTVRHAAADDDDHLRAYGVGCARGEWVVCVSDQSIFRPQALNAIRELTADPDRDVVFHYIHNCKEPRACMLGAIVRRELIDLAAYTPDSSDKFGTGMLRAVLDAGARFALNDRCVHVMDPNALDPSFDSVSIHLVDHCNLNCAHCSHFSPVATPRYITADELRRDLGGLPPMREVYLIGGEPLLHPQLPELLEIARACQPNARIVILTNGTLLPQMSPEFHEAVERNSITIIFVRYPDSELPYDSSEAALANHADRATWWVGDFKRMRLDAFGSHDPLLTYLSCENHFPQVREGYVYPCPTSAFASALNERFGLEFTHAEGDRLRIEDVHSQDDIRIWMMTEKPFCRYCAVDSWDFCPWHRSDFKADEWICDDAQLTDD